MVLGVALLRTDSQAGLVALAVAFFWRRCFRRPAAARGAGRRRPRRGRDALLHAGDRASRIPDDILVRQHVQSRVPLGGRGGHGLGSSDPRSRSRKLLGARAVLHRSSNQPAEGRPDRRGASSRTTRTCRFSPSSGSSDSSPSSASLRRHWPSAFAPFEPFERGGDVTGERLARAVVIGTTAMLVAYFFATNHYEKQLWLMLGTCLARLTRPGAHSAPGDFHRLTRASRRPVDRALLRARAARAPR